MSPECGLDAVYDYRGNTLTQLRAMSRTSERAQHTRSDHTEAQTINPE